MFLENVPSGSVSKVLKSIIRSRLENTERLSSIIKGRCVTVLKEVEAKNRKWIMGLCEMCS